MKKPLKLIGIAILLIVVVVGIICLVVNSKKTAITKEKFEEIAKKAGYTVTSIENDVNDNENINEAYVAINKDLTNFVEYYQFNDSEQAKEFFGEKREEYEKNKADGDVAKEKSGKNYTQYTLKSKDRYMYIMQIENTVASLNVDENKEKEISDLIRKLGY